VLGGLGYMKTYPFERYLRDARILLIFEVGLYLKSFKAAKLEVMIGINYSQKCWGGS